MTGSRTVAPPVPEALGASVRIDAGIASAPLMAQASVTGDPALRSWRMLHPHRSGRFDPDLCKNRKSVRDQDGVSMIIAEELDAIGAVSH